MKVMGLPNWLHWLSWFLKSFIVFLAVGLVVVLTIKVKFTQKAIVHFVDASVLITFMILYNCSLITFGFLISTISPSGNLLKSVSKLFITKFSAFTASLIGFIVFLVSKIPFKIVDSFPQRSSLPLKLTACLLPNTALQFGFKIIKSYQIDPPPSGTVFRKKSHSF